MENELIKIVRLAKRFVETKELETGFINLPIETIKAILDLAEHNAGKSTAKIICDQGNIPLSELKRRYLIVNKDWSSGWQELKRRIDNEK